MSETREIITIQLGKYANFVGTHWWNIQESSFCYDSSQTEKLLINHDVLFREGISHCGETTFTPRLISVGLKGSLGTLKREGTLYDSTNQQQQQTTPVWGGQVSVLKSEPEQRNQFLEDLNQQEQSHHPSRQNVFDEDKDVCLDPNSGKSIQYFPKSKLYDLNNTIRYWSDFLRPHLHPRSIYLLENYFYEDEGNNFDLYGLGLQTYREENTREELEEICRKMSEECNYMQGFNLLLDSQDGFSGMASGLVEHLKDEYGNKCLHSYPLCQPGYPVDGKDDKMAENHRLLNFLFCLENVGFKSDLFSILNAGRGTFEETQSFRNFENVSYQSSLPYHTSAILAGWLNNTTLNIRLKSNPSNMKEQTQLLTPSDRKCLTASMSFPFPLREKSYLSELKKGEISLTPLTPHLDVLNQSEISVQSLTLSGIPPGMLQATSSNSRNSHQSVNLQEVIVRSLKSFWTSQYNSVNIIATPCHVTAPFPHIFNRTITDKGFLTDSSPRSPNTGVESVPILSGLHNTDSVVLLFQKTLQDVQKIKMNNLRSFFEAGIEKDDFNETKNTFMNFAENYRENIFKEK